MLITAILTMAFVMGILAVLCIGLGLALYAVLTGRWKVDQTDQQPYVGWQHTPSVLQRAKR